MATWPDALFFLTEPGAKGLRISKFNGNKGVDSWPVFLKGIELLEKEPDRFKTVIIDTADRLYDMCQDYVCEQRGVNHPSEINDGKGDYGGTWAYIRKEFSNAIQRLIRTGRGVNFTSHVKERTFRPRDGVEYDRIYPSMGTAARETIEALVDYYFFAEYYGNGKRMLICRGTEQVWAGSRPSPHVPEFPQFLPLDERGFEVIKEAFEGKYEGLDPLKITVSNVNKESVVKLLAKSKTQAAAVAAKSK